MHNRSQARYFRLRWSPRWDPDELRDHLRRRRAIWQRYSRLHDEFPHPRLWPDDRFVLPGLMRQILRFEKWAHELEASSAVGSDNNNSKRSSTKDNASDGWCRTTPSSGYWDYHHNPFRVYRSASCTNSEIPRDHVIYSSKGDEPTPGKSSTSTKIPISTPKDTGYVNSTATNGGASSDYYIDPVTNKKVPKRVDEISTSGAKESNVVHDARELELNVSDAGEAAEVSTKPLPSGKQVDSHENPSTTADLQSDGKDEPAIQGHTNGKLSKDEPSKPMTGYYVRDFPEEFSGSWAENFRSEENLPESKPSTGRLEPALNRAPAETTATSPQEESSPGNENQAGTRRTPHRELVEEIRDIYEESYGKLNTQPLILASSTEGASTAPADLQAEGEGPKVESSASENTASPAAPSETNLYKILVYDSEAGSVSTADAASVAPDHQEVLTPAQAMTRLTHPARFLPYFGPLQAQGYEVISGSGDVLIFRKVRDATEPGTVFLRGVTGATVPDSTGAASADSKTTSPAPAVNPIDMMGSEPIIPNIGNFTSPTGYVSYDHDLSIGGGESGFVVKPPPPFRKYNSIAATSDADTSYDGNKKTKGKRSRPLWRVTVGACSMAGLVYGGSVINEYFKTGGESGEGSKGHL